MTDGVSASIWHLELDRIGWQWRCGNAKVERAQRLCQQRCDANSVDDVAYMIGDYVAMDILRQKHQSLFARGRVALVDFFIQDQQNLILMCTIVARLAKSV